MNNDNKKQNVNSWWMPAFMVFIRVSGYIVIPIVFSMIIGKNLDNYFKTKPIIFLILIGFSFIFSSFSILKIVKKYITTIKELGMNKDDI